MRPQASTKMESGYPSISADTAVKPSEDDVESVRDSVASLEAEVIEVVPAKPTVVHHR